MCLSAEGSPTESTPWVERPLKISANGAGTFFLVNGCVDVHVDEEPVEVNATDLENEFGLGLVMWIATFYIFTIGFVNWYPDFSFQDWFQHRFTEFWAQGVVVKAFAVYGGLMLATQTWWAEVFEFLVRLLPRLLIQFPKLVISLTVFFLVSLVHGYWCMFAPNAVVDNPAFSYRPPLKRV